MRCFTLTVFAAALAVSSATIGDLFLMTDAVSSGAVCLDGGTGVYPRGFLETAFLREQAPLVAIILRVGLDLVQTSGISTTR